MLLTIKVQTIHAIWSALCALIPAKTQF